MIVLQAFGYALRWITFIHYRLSEIGTHTRQHTQLSRDTREDFGRFSVRSTFTDDTSQIFQRIFTYFIFCFTGINENETQNSNRKKNAN